MRSRWKPVPPPMQPDEQAEPLVAGSAAEPVLLTLPDELLRAVGQEAWSPLVPAASAALARACRGPFLTLERDFRDKGGC